MSRTLLLVDDEPNILSALSRVFRRYDYRILRAGSGPEGLELLAKEAVGVIVSDQRMPQMSGSEFLRQAKTICPASIRIVLSGYTDLQSVTNAVNDGAIHKFLTKPWDDEQLRREVEQAFECYERQQSDRGLAEEVRRRREAQAQGEVRPELPRDSLSSIAATRMLQTALAILEHLPIGVLGIDESGLVVAVSYYARSILQPDCAPAVGLHYADTLPPVLIELIGSGRSGAETSMPLSDHRSVGARLQRLDASGVDLGCVIILNTGTRASAEQPEVASRVSRLGRPQM